MFTILVNSRLPMKPNLNTPQKFNPQGNFFKVPMLGSIKAGFPVSDEQYDGEGVSLEHFLLANPDKTYLLRVQDENLLSEGIRPGDLVILDAKRTPTENDIVAACIDDRWTVNHFKSLDSQNREIGGVVVSVIRKFY